MSRAVWYNEVCDKKGMIFPRIITYFVFMGYQSNSEKMKTNPSRILPRRVP